EADAQCLHAVILDEQKQPVATGRLLPDGHIGRMAVLADRRRGGLGGRVLEALIEAARQRGHDRVMLSAQVHALSFYRGHGFEAEGQIYDDVGIPHQDMTRRLRP
ncbi:MAG: GNAT family N-acetyltransferase, partial [Burkholderiales bacterium]